MLKASICVSVPNNRKILKEMLEECFFENKIGHSLVMFNNGSSLIDYLEKGHELDVLFVENELNDIDGEVVVKQIRTVLNNYNVKIILISELKTDILKLFKLQLYDFMNLPLIKSDINKLIIKINAKYIDNMDCFYYRSKGALIKSDLDSIIYFKSDNRKIILHKKNSVIEFYDRLKDIMKRIDGSCFWQVHQSYLINMNHAKKIDENGIFLDDGSVIPISKSHKAIVNAERRFINL